MTRIDPNAQVLLLLKERLERTARTQGPRNTAAPGATERLAALAAREDLPERGFRKAVLRAMLSQRVGDALAGDAQFDQVIAQVLDLIEDNAETRALLDRAVAALRDPSA